MFDDCLHILRSKHPSLSYPPPSPLHCLWSSHSVNIIFGWPFAPPSELLLVSEPILMNQLILTQSSRLWFFLKEKQWELETSGPNSESEKNNLKRIKTHDWLLFTYPSVILGWDSLSRSRLHEMIHRSLVKIDKSFRGTNIFIAQNIREK